MSNEVGRHWISRGVGWAFPGRDPHGKGREAGMCRGRGGGVGGELKFRSPAGPKWKRQGSPANGREGEKKRICRV